MMNSIVLGRVVVLNQEKAFTEGNPFDFAQGKLKTKVVNSAPSVSSFASVSLFTGAFTDY
jgi:hypothetical protein